MKRKHFQWSLLLPLAFLSFHSCGGGSSGSDSTSSTTVTSLDPSNPEVTNTITDITDTDALTQNQGNDLNNLPEFPDPLVDETGDSIDTAPSTLDATSLILYGSESNNTFRFDFARIAGSASEGGVERGFCNSFETTGPSINVTRVDPSLQISTLDSDDPEDGADLNLIDLPTRVTDVSYTYSKISSNSGTLTLRGDGIGDGMTPIDQDTGLLTDPLDIFVNRSTDLQPFFANLRITFGSDGNGSIGQISVEGTVNGTSATEVVTDFAPSIDPDIEPVTFFAPSALEEGQIFDITTNTSREGTIIELQDGNSVPINFGLTDAESVVRRTPPTVYPPTLAPVVPAFLNFNYENCPNSDVTDSAITSTSYTLFGVTSLDQGFQDAADQGLVSVRINYLNAAGEPTSCNEFTDIPFALTPVDGSNSVANLTLVLPYPTGSTTNEVYQLSFSSTESATLTQLQPFGTTGTGTASFPVADTADR